jgi:hypothetical protein
LKIQTVSEAQWIAFYAKHREKAERKLKDVKPLTIDETKKSLAAPVNNLDELANLGAETKVARIGNQYFERHKGTGGFCEEGTQVHPHSGIDRTAIVAGGSKVCDARLRSDVWILDQSIVCSNANIIQGVRVSQTLVPEGFTYYGDKGPKAQEHEAKTRQPTGFGPQGGALGAKWAREPGASGYT